MVKLPYHTIPKSKAKTCMVEEPSDVKLLSLNHVCKIGLGSVGNNRYVMSCTYKYMYDERLQKQPGCASVKVTF